MILPNGFRKVEDEDNILFYKLGFYGGIPKVKYSIQIKADLSVCAWFENEKLTNIDNFVNTWTSVLQYFDIFRCF